MVNTTAIPKWVWNRYALLWKKFGDKPITFEQAQKELKYLNRNVISVIFNKLKTAGWIAVNLGEGDSRKRVYTLISSIEVVENTKNDAKKNRTELTKMTENGKYKKRSLLKN